MTKGSWTRIWLKTKNSDFTFIIILICSECRGIKEIYNDCIYCKGTAIEPIPLSELLYKEDLKETADEYSRKRRFL